jgi:hypothetical protein
VADNIVSTNLSNSSVYSASLIIHYCYSFSSEKHPQALEITVTSIQKSAQTYPSARELEKSCRGPRACHRLTNVGQWSLVHLLADLNLRSTYSKQQKPYKSIITIFRFQPLRLNWVSTESIVPFRFNSFF